MVLFWSLFRMCVIVWLMFYVVFNTLSVISWWWLLVAWDAIAFGFKVLPTLMHRATDRKHKCTTGSHYPDTGPTSPGFLLLLLSVSEESASTNCNAFGLALPEFEPATSRLRGERSHLSATAFRIRCKIKIKSVENVGLTQQWVFPLTGSGHWYGQLHV